MGVDPSPVWVIGNQVCLSCKLRYPEAVIRGGGKQFQECRCGMSGVAHRDMEFVCGDDAELGILKFPPKLMPDCGPLHRLCGPRRVLDRVNHSRGRQKEDNNDQNRNDGPGQLNLRASIHLRWLTLCVRHSPTEFHNDIAHYTEPDEQNQPNYTEDVMGQMADRIRWRGVRIDNAGNRVVLR